MRMALLLPNDERCLEHANSSGTGRGCARRKGEKIMMNKVLSVLVAGALSAASVLYGQADNPAQKKEKQKQQADRPGQETLTGCLTEEQGAFKLATGAGEQVDVSGPAALTKHKNHTVKLTGTTSNEGGKKMLVVSKIEHVSAS